MRKNAIKALAVAMAAAMAVTVAVPAVPTQAAEKTSTYLVTKAKYNDGTTTTYKYNKQGWVSQEKTVSSYTIKDTDDVKAYTYQTTDANGNAITTYQDNISPTASGYYSDGTTTDYICKFNGVEYPSWTEAYAAMTAANQAAFAATGEMPYDLYDITSVGFVKKSDATGSKTETDSYKTTKVTKKTYYSSGKKKGQVKKEVTTTTTVHTKVVDASSADVAFNAYLDSAYDTGYTCTTKVTDTTTYTYSKKGVKKTSHEEIVTPDGTYSALSGLALKATQDSTSSDYDLYNNRNQGSKTRSIDVAYTVKKGNVTKAVASTTETEISSNDITTTDDNDVETVIGTATSTQVSKLADITLKYKYNKYGEPTKMTQTGGASVTVNKSTTNEYKNGTTNTYADKEFTKNFDNTTGTVTYKYDKSLNLKSKTIKKNASTAYYKAMTYYFQTQTTPTTTIFADEYFTTTSTKQTIKYTNEISEKTGKIATQTATVSAALESGEKDAYTDLYQVKYTVKKKNVPAANATGIFTQQMLIQNKMADSQVGSVSIVK